MGVHIGPRHLVNTIEPSICGGDAASLSNYFDHLLCSYALPDDEWEIPFENISELTWLGSGSQGAVFLGRVGHEQVAVKKVRDVKETDVKHLRRLNHPNVVSIRYTGSSPLASTHTLSRT